MKIVVGIPNDSYETLKMLSERPMFWLDFYQRLIVNGTPLPEGAEILTKEAYSDLCLRASQGSKTGKWEVAEKYNSNGVRTICVCNQCRGFYTDDADEMNYCPHCGTRMEGADDAKS